MLFPCHLSLCEVYVVGVPDNGQADGELDSKLRGGLEIPTGWPLQHAVGSRLLEFEWSVGPNDAYRLPAQRCTSTPTSDLRFHHYLAHPIQRIASFCIFAVSFV